ncbi:tetratricopeptide repeat protein [Streptomyces sp. NPDC045431]|uniref:tetratricopeptide repeat protein n=1 Tax=Streptomyces sp. NPDC045431 TaxID=3155613 RepID=UPI0033C31B66
MSDETRNSVGGSARVDTVVQAGRIGELHQHRHDHHHVTPPPPELTAHQLPPRPRHFENRDAEQRRLLSAALTDRPRDGRPFVAALSGLHGVGKTTLGVLLARKLVDRHTGEHTSGEQASHERASGELTSGEQASDERAIRYIDLDDHRTDGGADIAEALADLLRSLGVHPGWIERTLAGRRRQYWASTEHRPLVLVLDNVRYGTEVDQLLPASPHSTVIAIGRRRLYDIRGGADLDLPLGPLDAHHAQQLLRRIAADDPRLSAEATAVAELARACAGLPAALEVAAEWLRRHRRRPLGRLVTQLADTWRDNGVPEVEAVWNTAYRELSPESARLYRLLAVHPGPYVAPDAVAALLGTGPDAAEDALDELEVSALLPLGRGGLYRLHDLLRDHAHRSARRDDPDGTEAAAGRTRIIRWYLRQAQRADALWAGARLTLAAPVPPLPGDVPDVDWGTERGDALRWLEARRHALFAAVRSAYRHGMDDEAWALCEPLWTHFLDHQHYADVTDAFTAGRDAARRAGNVPALIRMRCQLARPLWEQERFDEAEAEVEAAVDAAAGLGDSTLHRKLRASASEFRGKLRTVRGDWRAAAPDFETARRIHQEIGNDYGVMLQTYLLAQTARETGDLGAAVRLAEQAHRMAAAPPERPRMMARTAFELGRTLHALGRTDEARPLYASALSGARERAATREQATILTALAALADDTGDRPAAQRHREEARAIRAAATAAD